MCIRDRHNVTPPTEEEMRHPFLWRHWNMLPKKGEISILDCSWYQDISAYPLLNQADEDKDVYKRQAFNCTSL